MNITSIKSQITKHIKKSMNSKNPRLKNWYVGITNDEKRRKAEHNAKIINLKYWKCFNAGSLRSANEIEAYFSKKGTSNRPSKNGANEKSKFVYVFKKPNKKPLGLNGAFTENNLFGFLFDEK